MGLATHSGGIGLYPNLKDFEERIYSGGRHVSVVLLTIELRGMFDSTMATVEVLVNGNSGSSLCCETVSPPI